MASKAQNIPTPALVLGIAGLIPFITCAVLAWVPELGSNLLGSSQSAGSDDGTSANSIKQQAVLALGAYGAIILSFLGGIRWGNDPGADRC